MKDWVERCLMLPFSCGCLTQSSVAVAATHQHKKPNQLIIKRRYENGFLVQKEETEIENNDSTISDGINKIIRSFKSFSHFFIRYEEEEMREEREGEMEIGFPTDVKHLSHIGVDGTMTTFNVSSFPSHCRLI